MCGGGAPSTINILPLSSLSSDKIATLSWIADKLRGGVLVREPWRSEITHTHTNAHVTPLLSTRAILTLIHGPFELGLDLGSSKPFWRRMYSTHSLLRDGSSLEKCVTFQGERV